MEGDGFYVTLPSNASKDLFPENTSAAFTVRMFKPLDLRGEWEVGLVEFHYPRTWYVLTDAAVFKISDATNTWEYQLRQGYYFDLRTLTEFMNNAIKKHSRPPAPELQFHFDTTAAMLGIRGINTYSVTVSEELARVLGAPPNVAFKKVHHCGDITGGFNTLYVYTDIAEHQIVGDTAVPLLRCVPVQGKAHDFITVTYDEPHYIPINKHHIETICIEIKTDQNRPVPFRYGKVIVRLHIRQRKKW